MLGMLIKNISSILISSRMATVYKNVFSAVVLGVLMTVSAVPKKPENG